MRFAQPDVERTMRWLRANGVEHGPEEIIDGSVWSNGASITYETVRLIEGGYAHRTPHRVKMAVTMHEANTPRASYCTII